MRCRGEVTSPLPPATRSTNTSMIPPHTPNVCIETSSVRSTRTVVGSPVWITSSAARSTSASPQPPPTVPTCRPSGWMIILAPTSRGTEPLMSMMVATATVSSASMKSFSLA